MVKIQINSQNYCRIRLVSDTFYNYLRNSVSRPYLRDGVLNFALSKFNFSLKKFNLKYDIESDEIKPIFDITQHFFHI